MNYDVIIVGAGPVGLLLANLLGANNIKTLVLEKNYKMNPGSRAIGISPPSLGILRVKLLFLIVHLSSWEL